MNYKASVCILTKNPGAIFRSVLATVLAQATPWPFEVLVVDSGSRDGTLEFCKSLDRVRLHAIPPGEFGHGRTRNLAVTITSGEFAVMLTHDALPADARWLFRLVAAAEQSADIAGAFGRHRPYPGCNPFVARDLKLHFDALRAWPAVLRLDDRERYARDEGYRQILHYFSDNNACLRRSVWEKIPYPDVDFAEDQLWAQKAIEAGYARAYADDAAVFHSHNYSCLKAGRRAFDEARAYYVLFGYRLCPTLRQALRQFAQCTLRDLAYARRNRLFWNSPWCALRAPVFNLARQIGHYGGQRAQRLPASLARGISLDQSLQNAK